MIGNKFSFHSNGILVSILDSSAASSYSNAVSSYSKPCLFQRSLVFIHGAPNTVIR